MKKAIAPLCRNAGASLFLLLVSVFSFSQNNFRVTGTVKDETGKPVDAATISIKGTNTATATKPDGSFEITAPTGKSTLVISHVGFLQLDYLLQNQSTVTITVTNTSASLEDVV
ncbi:MAG: carboxypeptidase-like regulatory domain-containing protein, partial [Flavisolibacter sp.]